MMRAVLLTASILLTPRLSWACDADVSTADLNLVIDEVEAAYIALDVSGVTDRLAALDALTPCLSESIPRTDMARYHRAQGLGAFINRDAEAASRAFLAARSIEPDATLPSSLVSQGHPVQLLYARLSLEDREYGPMPEPVNSYLLLDGRQDTPRPLSHPVLLQRIEDAGSVVQSAYLWPVDAMPFFPVAPPDLPGPPEEPTILNVEPVVPPDTEPGRGLVLVGTSVSAVITGASFMLNRSWRNQYYSSGITLDGLDAQQRKINRSGAATLGAAALAFAGGVALEVVW